MLCCAVPHGCDTAPPTAASKRLKTPNAQAHRQNTSCTLPAGRPVQLIGYPYPYENRLQRQQAVPAQQTLRSVQPQHDLAQGLGIGTVLLGCLPRQEEFCCQQGNAWMSVTACSRHFPPWCAIWLLCLATNSTHSPPLCRASMRLKTWSGRPRRPKTPPMSARPSSALRSA